MKRVMIALMTVSIIMTGCQSSGSKASAADFLLPEKERASEMAGVFGSPLKEAASGFGLDAEQAEETHPEQFAFKETAEFEGVVMTISLYTHENKTGAIEYKGILEGESGKIAEIALKMYEKAKELYGDPVTDPGVDTSFEGKDVKAFIEEGEMKDLADYWQIGENVMVKAALEVYGDTGKCGLIFSIGQGTYGAYRP